MPGQPSGTLDPSVKPPARRTGFPPASEAPGLHQHGSLIELRLQEHCEPPGWILGSRPQVKRGGQNELRGTPPLALACTRVSALRCARFASSPQRAGGALRVAQRDARIA